MLIYIKYIRFFFWEQPNIVLFPCLLLKYCIWREIGISTLIMLVSIFLNNVIKGNFLHYRHVTDSHQHVDFDYVGLLKNKISVV